MQLKFIGDVGLKFLRAMYSSSVYVQPLGTTACLCTLGRSSVLCNPWVSPRGAYPR